RPWSEYANDPLRARLGPQWAAQLREGLGRRVPPYMVPASFVLLERLPLTANGKVDRKALPLPDRRANLLQGYVAPATPLEKALSQIWLEVLRLDEVGVEDNFFELGGHSLLATRVIAHVRDVLQVELPLRVLFESPTVRGMALQVERAQREQEGLTA